jgi:zinc transport system substrate-binding protein
MKPIRSTRKIKIVAPLTALLIVVVLVTSCSTSSKNSSNPGNSRPVIVTSFYPLEFVATSITGKNFEVINLIPAGGEPHDFELTPKLSGTLLKADLALVLGGDFQPAIEKTASSRDRDTLVLMDEIDPNSRDPHIWLDPLLMKKVVEQFTLKVKQIDPKNKGTYDLNKEELLTKLDALNQSFETKLRTCEIRTFVTSHDAFSRLADRYDLVQESISGISPEAEPTPNRIEELKDIVKDKKIEVIFTEEQVSKKVAETLSREANVSTQVLSPIEYLPKVQTGEFQDYLTVMKSNLEKLSKALRCS